MKHTVRSETPNLSHIFYTKYNWREVVFYIMQSFERELFSLWLICASEILDRLTYMLTCGLLLGVSDVRKN